MSEAPSADRVAALRGSLEENDAWTCYDTVRGTFGDTVSGALVRCHYYVAGAEPQYQGTFVTDPPALGAAVTTAVGDILLDGAGETLASAFRQSNRLDVEELGAPVVFSPSTTVFVLRADGADEFAPGQPSPDDATAMAPALTAAGYHCRDDEIEIFDVVCSKTVRGHEITLHGSSGDFDTAAWTASVLTDDPWDPSVRELVASELVALGLTDDAGASFLQAADHMQEGDFAGFALGVSMGTPGIPSARMSAPSSDLPLGRRPFPATP